MQHLCQHQNINFTEHNKRRLASFWEKCTQNHWLSQYSDLILRVGSISSIMMLYLWYSVKFSIIDIDPLVSTNFCYKRPALHLLCLFYGVQSYMSVISSLINFLCNTNNWIVESHSKHYGIVNLLIILREGLHCWKYT